MVTKKIYIRLGKTETGGYKVDGSLKPNLSPLWTSSDRKTNKAIATVRFAVEVDIPDEKFNAEGIPIAKINFKLEEERLMVKAVEAI